MKHVAIVAPHFVPSGLTSVHRARLLASYLPRFGWKPTVITVHEKYYKEKLDPELACLLPAELDVRKSSAIPTWATFLIGDIGVRGFFGMYYEIARLHRELPINFLYITIPSNYAALLGPLVYKHLAIRYGIDYIDPWVHPWPGAEKWFTKHWLSYNLSKILEPLSVKHASLITGIAPGYYEDVLERNPTTRSRVITAAMPYGWADKDYEYLKGSSRKPFIFDSDDGNLHLVYAGAMLPKGYPILEILLESLVQLVDSEPEWMSRVRIHFIGTGKSPDDTTAFNVKPYIEKYNLSNWVTEYPSRISYLDTLNHLIHSWAILILGSVEPHYSPSKVFQAAMSGRPLLALLHDRSAAVDVIKESRCGIAVTFNEKKVLRVDEVVVAFKKIITEAKSIAGSSSLKVFKKYSAIESAKTLAVSLDKALLPFR